MIGEHTTNHAIIHKAGVEDNYLLLELPEELMHCDLRIRGTPEDEAVICTDNKTFKVCSVQTSNTRLIIGEDGQVHFKGSNYLRLPEARSVPSGVSGLPPTAAPAPACLRGEILGQAGEIRDTQAGADVVGLAWCSRVVEVVVTGARGPSGVKGDPGRSANR